MKPTIKGAMAWMGTWVAGLAVGAELLQIETFAYICLWGVMIYFLANFVEMWINTPVEKE